MRVPRGRLTLAAACCAAVAAVPASIAQANSPGGALSTGVAPADAPAVASKAAVKGAISIHLVATPARPTVGAPVQLSVTAPVPGATGFAWDLAGQGAFTRHTAGPRATVSFATPGTHTVAMRFTAGGQARLAVLTVTVAPRPVARARPRPPARPRSQPRSRPASAAGLSGTVTAHIAGDPGVTIADFHFTPASTTIHAGDTITWSNSGPSSHTATASNGSFNTGVLKKGQRASHTFTQPGTYAYACQIHPFMHGTVTVLARTTSTTPASSTPATTPTATATAAAAPSGPTLPNTGFNVLAGLFAGLLLLGLGAALRRTRAR